MMLGEAWDLLSEELKTPVVREKIGSVLADLFSAKEGQIRNTRTNSSNEIRQEVVFEICDIYTKLNPAIGLNMSYKILKDEYDMARRSNSAKAQEHDITIYRSLLWIEQALSGMDDKQKEGLAIRKDFVKTLTDLIETKVEYIERNGMDDIARELVINAYYLLGKIPVTQEEQDRIDSLIERFFY